MNRTMDAIFVGFLAAVATAVVVAVGRHASRRAAVRVAVRLVAWFTYVGVIGHAGLIRNATSRPPGIAFVGVPVAVYVVTVLARRPTATFPVRLLLGAQCFRVGVELFIHQLWVGGLVPRMLTYRGANVDIYVGITAPLIARLATGGRRGLRVALPWNGLGLLALANVVARAVLTAPGPLNRLHAEVPDLMIGTLPYTFIPAFFVPLAIVLHVSSIRAIGARLRSSASA